MIFAAIGRLWRAHQRKTDVRILWPCCKRAAAQECYLACTLQDSHRSLLSRARGAFLLHCAQDTAWTKDFTFQEIERIVATLK